MKDKIILITGANRGIGLRTVQVFLEAKATVIANHRENKDNLEALKEEFGEKLTLIKADVSKANEVKQMFAEIKSKFNHLDVLVNNAGILEDNLLLMVKEEEFDSLIDTNLKGTFLCMQQATKMMMRQNSGSIINISSIVGIEGNAGQTAYSASKAGILGLTKSAAKELSQFNIRVNAIAPGLIETDMTRHLTPAAIDNFVKKSSLKKIGKPDDVAKVILFLASEKAQSITGQVIPVDGEFNL